MINNDAFCNKGVPNPKNQGGSRTAPLQLYAAFGITELPCTNRSQPMKKSLILLAMMTVTILALGRPTAAADMSTTGYNLTNGGMSNLGGSMTDGGNVIASSNMYPAVGVPAGGLSLSPAAATFATTNSGAVSASATFTLANDGATSVSVSAITLTGTNASQFSIVSSGATSCASVPFALIPGTSCTVNVTFAPTAIGAKSATLQVTSNDTTNPTMSAVLSGTAILATYSIGSAVIGSGGAINCTTPVNQSAASTCTISPTAGYLLATLTDNGTDVKSQVVSGPPATYTISNVTADHSVTGTFATKPDPPTIGTATAGTAQATVSFTAPVSDGGSAITGYTVTSSPAGGTDSNAGTTSLSHIITGLNNGTAYTFTVVATNRAGNSAASGSSNSVTPFTIPSAPTIGSATAGNAQATVIITAPASNGGSAITGYTVTSNPAGGVDSNAGTIALSHVITNLTNGTAYTFTVVAANAAGNSATSAASASVTPSPNVPGAPTIGSATAGNLQATVTFTAPTSTGGSAITGYTVTSTPGGITKTGTASPITVTGLTAGTAYTFTVIATNVAGNSAASAASNSVTIPLPTTLPDGDLDGDGKVTIADALRAQQIAVGLITPTAADLAKGDVAPLVSGKPVPDGKINTGDVVVILEKIVWTVTW
jgi:hypothetical protein